MIYTVTFNPAIDYIVKVDNFTLDNVNRSNENFKYPGGKGINVSRVLNNLEVKNRALGFIGGFTGKYIKDFLEKEGLDTDFILVEEDSRINVKIKSGKETEINGRGPFISDENLQRLFNKINKLSSDDFLILAGNVQEHLSRDIYSRIQEVTLNNNVNVIVDTTKEALLKTLKYKPLLIKPNVHELGELFGVGIETEEKVIQYGKKLIEMGAKNVIVSMAGEGAILISQEGVYHGIAPKGVVNNSVGAGDSMIAGFIANYHQSNNIVESFKWGLASGSATAFSLDLCKKQDVVNLLSQVKVNKLLQ